MVVRRCHDKLGFCDQGNLDGEVGSPVGSGAYAQGMAGALGFGGPTCTELSLSQNDVRWQAYSDAKYYAGDGVRDSCQWPQLTRHDKVPDRQVEG